MIVHPTIIDKQERHGHRVLVPFVFCSPPTTARAPLPPPSQRSPATLHCGSSERTVEHREGLGKFPAKTPEHVPARTGGRDRLAPEECTRTQDREFPQAPAGTHRPIRLDRSEYPARYCDGWRHSGGDGGASTGTWSSASYRAGSTRQHLLAAVVAHTAVAAGTPYSGSHRSRLACGSIRSACIPALRLPVWHRLWLCRHTTAWIPCNAATRAGWSASSSQQSSCSTRSVRTPLRDHGTPGAPIAGLGCRTISR